MRVESCVCVWGGRALWGESLVGGDLWGGRAMGGEEAMLVRKSRVGGRAVWGEEAMWVQKSRVCVCGGELGGWGSHVGGGAVWRGELWVRKSCVGGIACAWCPPSWPRGYRVGPAHLLLGAGGPSFSNTRLRKGPSKPLPTDMARGLRVTWWRLRLACRAALSFSSCFTRIFTTSCRNFSLASLVSRPPSRA